MSYLVLSFLKNTILTLRYTVFKTIALLSRQDAIFFTRLIDRQFLYITLPSVYVYLTLLLIELYHFYHLLIFRIIPLAALPVTSSCHSVRRHWDTFVSNLSHCCLPIDFILLAYSSVDDLLTSSTDP